MSESLYGVDVRLAQTFHRRQIIYHVRERNADGSPLRAYVNGKIHLWKRKPWKFSLPMSIGLYGHFRLCEGMSQDWRTKEEWAR